MSKQQFGIDSARQRHTALFKSMRTPTVIEKGCKCIKADKQCRDFRQTGNCLPLLFLGSCWKFSEILGSAEEPESSETEIKGFQNLRKHTRSNTSYEIKIFTGTAYNSNMRWHQELYSFLYPTSPQSWAKRWTATSTGVWSSKPVELRTVQEQV